MPCSRTQHGLTQDNRRTAHDVIQFNLIITRLVMIGFGLLKTRARTKLLNTVSLISRSNSMGHRDSVSVLLFMTDKFFFFFFDNIYRPTRYLPLISRETDVFYQVIKY